MSVNVQFEQDGAPGQPDDFEDGPDEPGVLTGPRKRPRPDKKSGGRRTRGSDGEDNAADGEDFGKVRREHARDRYWRKHRDDVPW